MFATSFAGSSWPQPASLPSTLKLGKLAKQNLLPGLSSFCDLGCSGQSLEAKFLQCFDFDFPRAQLPQASGTAPTSHKLDHHTYVSILAGSGAWGCPFWGLGNPPADCSSLLLN
eukprot:1149428-Pelagomonas_calceolata.AAC.3